MRYCLERIAYVRNEADALIKDYYERTVAGNNTPPLDMSWDLFELLDSTDQILCVTARFDDDKLCGFVLYVVGCMPHHKTLFSATCDTLAVDPDFRSKGIGRKLMEVAEKLLVTCGVVCIMHFARSVYTDTVPLFEKQGYDKYQVGYIKYLGK